MTSKRKTGKAAHRINKNEMNMEERRKIVAANLLAGATHQDIAEVLNVSTTTISKDRRAIIKEWRKHYTDNANEYVEIQMRRLDILINGIWDQAKGGSVSHIDRVMRLIERQEKLLGIGAGSPEQNKGAGINVNIRIDDLQKDIDEVKDYEREQYGLAGEPIKPSQN